MNGPQPIADLAGEGHEAGDAARTGSKDQLCIAAAMPAIDSMMKALKKDYSSTNYDGAVHGFLSRAQDDPKQTRDEAEEKATLAAAKDAWPKTIAFLKRRISNRGRETETGAAKVNPRDALLTRRNILRVSASHPSPVSRPASRLLHRENLVRSLERCQRVGSRRDEFVRDEARSSYRRSRSRLRAS